MTSEELNELRMDARYAREKEAEPEDFEALPKDYRSCLDDDERPHGRNPAIFDGPCDCDECQAWDQKQRTKPMTLKDLSDAVMALVPKAHRVDISLILRTQEQTWLIEPKDEPLVEVLAEISVWIDREYHGVDAPTYEAALERFKAECLPTIFPPVPSPVPAMERLAAMEPKI